ncbi:FecCD family ABC transporter permease [Benzoatithermus flavus]|uniref:Iron ABC transporter permease n=1 Tax=Benzoatithermus flavus TaxID=3108223 RepID=A0ABU8XU89_9PROT
MTSPLACLPTARAVPNPRNLALPLLALLLAACTVAAIAIGAVPIPLARLPALLLAGWNGDGDTTGLAQEATVLWYIRLPRIALAVAVGLALGTCGGTIQGLFRNPLADPGLIGVSGGAALAAAAWIVVGPLLPLPDPLQSLGAWLLPVAAFAGGLAATMLVQRVGRRDGALDVASVLLAGIAVNAVTGAGIGGLVFASDDRALREVTFWMMGSLAGATWTGILPALPFLLAPALALPLRAVALDALLLGEREAYHLGFAVERTKRLVIVATACGTGAAVATTGIIGFVGLAAPHLARLLVGPGHRRLLPAAGCLGGCLILLADTAARTLVVPAELPIGVLTAGIGGPLFLHLLLRHRGRS